MHLSEGEEFLGMETIKSNVLYLNLELQPFAVKKRTEAMLNKLEINMGNFSTFVANGRGIRSQASEAWMRWLTT